MAIHCELHLLPLQISMISIIGIQSCADSTFHTKFYLSPNNCCNKIFKNSTFFLHAIGLTKQMAKKNRKISQMLAKKKMPATESQSWEKNDKLAFENNKRKYIYNIK